MSRFRCIALLVLTGATTLVGRELTPSERDWMQAKLTNWENVCLRHLRIPSEPLPWIIFYDALLAWHLNPEPGRLAGAEPAEFQLRFADRDVAILRVAHGEGLWIPSGRTLKLEPRAGTFAYDGNTKPFFIQALPAFWRTLPGAAKFPGLDEFFLGVASHEITHTRQIVAVARRLERLQTSGALPEQLDDDIVEHTFRHEVEYAAAHAREVKLLYEAVFEGDEAKSCALIQQALAAAEQRRERFFSGKHAALREADEIFVVMEGFAEWCQLQVLRDSEPQLGYAEAVQKLRGKDVPWVQDYGLALFVLIDRHVPGWPQLFLDPEFPSPYRTLANAITTAR